ncbi:small RNA-binding protein 11, chloroplastic isoform X1 [Hevea brasiliensis]|uniref:small RNA-binding protein 11, chloroplastic isoform X1 n=1 Tax=Hevea brasiliensis TaxID=3981 RepID=UPI0025E38CD9|nr:small RNA-binding protein 11, chloroplastic isoform X1 [Hevea brasiliensis]XP_021647035.2 small RNA-binding protein 11, chloroplastic isoform X1 [Hevea brasiliensis]XP_021647036.2 small RNA-binding protein 11, chloroplastic isoform X1 [Hevea brasiliensis]XP_021647037.2 small RNA-binding protein 11, chloroplastic isoform X1 [Hevea brasiliensis]XP_021647038.2 small RNA-binding protein 11, chloroplastic isoform X1 [Hevea brasiliensis]
MVSFRGISKSFYQILSQSNPNYLASQFFSRGFSSKLFVKGTNDFAAGISFSTTEKSLAEAFSKFGQVVESEIIRDKASNKSKGYGYVTFATEDEAKKAFMEMNGKLVDGRPVFVDNAWPRGSRGLVKQ